MSAPGVNSHEVLIVALLPPLPGPEVHPEVAGALPE
jgi:hypothetical protein